MQQGVKQQQANIQCQIQSPRPAHSHAPHTHTPTRSNSDGKGQDLSAQVAEAYTSVLVTYTSVYSTLLPLHQCPSDLGILVS
jgi:hypothetical protein